MGLLDTLLGHAGEKDLAKITEDFAPLLAPGEALHNSEAGQACSAPSA